MDGVGSGGETQYIVDGLQALCLRREHACARACASGAWPCNWRVATEHGSRGSEIGLLTEGLIHWTCLVRLVTGLLSYSPALSS
eukprot:COSAG02_NODE_2174_length_9589_cov_49.732561_10_plen_84_part_00